MGSIQQEITRLLSSDIVVQKAMQRGIINMRALAHYLIHEFSLPYSLDAVISSIRRFNIEKNELPEQKLQTVFSSMILSTKDNVALVVLKDNAFQTICHDYLDKQKLKENFRLIKSKERITIIVNQKDLEEKLSLFKHQDIIDVKKDLSEMRLQFKEDIGRLKGIIAKIANELWLYNVNIEEVIYDIPDLLIYIKEDDVVEAHKLLMKIKK